MSFSFSFKRKNCVKDKNALELTEKLVLVNPDVYTLWNYRKEILIEFKSKDAPESTPAGKEDQQQGNQTLKDAEATGDKIQQVSCDDQQTQIQPSTCQEIPCGKDVVDDDTDTRGRQNNEQASVFEQLCQQELALTQSCLMKQPKSYPVWHHRLWIVTRLMDNPDLQGELDLCSEALNYDSRNFHSWNYRKEIVKLAKISLEKEIEFTSEKIRQNFSNFSSWYLRSCLLTQASAQGEIDMENLWDKEYSLVENAIFTDPTDQSAWFYHKWLSSINLGRNLSTTQLRDELAMKLVICRPSDNLFAVKFNRATDVCPNFKLKLQPSALVYSSKVIMTCNTKSSYKQNIWTASRDLIDLSLAESIEISSSVNDNSLIIPLKKDTTVVARSRQQSFNVHHSSNRSLKEANIESLRMLQQLESDSKWINLTLSFYGDTQVKLDTLDTLCQLDPLRLNYYKDHKSKIIIESKLQELSNCTDSNCFIFKLISNNLTQLHFSPHLVHLRLMDLSGNKFTSLNRNFCTFVALEKLILDSNEVTSIDKELSLPSLKVLSLQMNKLIHVEQLDNLIYCQKLNRVCLFGNSIANEIASDETLKSKFTFVFLEKTDHLYTPSDFKDEKLIQIEF